MSDVGLGATWLSIYLDGTRGENTGRRYGVEYGDMGLRHLDAITSAGYKQ